MGTKWNVFTNNLDLVNAVDSFVAGPAVSTDNAIARFDGTTGKLIQNSGSTLSDTDVLSTGELNLTTDLDVTHGGTGRSTSDTAYGVICGGTTATGAHQTVSGVGIIGQALTSGGAGTLPTWTTVAGTGDVTAAANMTDNSIIRGNGGAKGVQDSGVLIDDSDNLNLPTGSVLQVNGASTLTATGLGAAVVASSLTSVGTIATGVWEGTVVADEYGGTGQSTYTKGDILYASGANTVAKLAIGTDGQVLSVSTDVPAWSAAAAGMPDYVVQWGAGALNVNYAPISPIEQITTTNVIQKVRAFDYAVIEYCDGKFEVPPDMDTTGTITFSLQWLARTVPSPSENVIWQIEHSAVATTEDLDSATFTAEVAAASATGTTQNALVRVTWTETRSNLGWVAGDTVFVKWSRKSTDANDTFDSVGTTADDALLVNAAIIIPQA